MRRFAAFLFCLGLLVATPHAVAQDDVPDDQSGEAAEGEAAPAAPVLPPPIYEAQLLRLSEILGALSFLRDLCGAEDGSAWRNEMQALLDAERPNADRRARLVGRFNHGFETFNAVYRTCTPSAELSIAHYLAEGERLAADVRSRYSQ